MLGTPGAHPERAVTPSAPSGRQAAQQPLALGEPRYASGGWTWLHRHAVLSTGSEYCRLAVELVCYVLDTPGAHQERAVTSSTPIETPSRTAAAGARRGALRQRWLDVATPRGGAIHGQRALLISSRARLLRARHVRSSSRARRDVEHADRDAKPHSGRWRSESSERRATPAVAGRGYTALRCYQRAASTADQQ